VKLESGLRALLDANVLVLAQNPGRASVALRDQRRLKLGRLRAAGQLSGPQLDALLDLLERAQLPQDALDYLAGTLDEDRFVRRVRAGGVPGVPAQ